MTYDPQKHHRRSIRLRGYDYSDPGAYFVTICNHIHGIIILHPYEGAMNCAPTLGLILRTFKALATRYLHAAGVSDFAWQRNYHEHITRKEGNLDGIRQYIIKNPN